MRLRRRSDFGQSPTLRWVVATSVRWPWRVLAVWASVACVASLGVARVEFETTGESLLDKSDPAWAYYQDSVDRFGGDKIIVLAVEGKRPFDPEALALIGDWTAAAERLPGVRRVDSLYTFPIVRGAPDGSLRLDPALTRSDSSASPDELQELLSRDRIAFRTLLSPDGRVLAVNVLLERMESEREAELVRSLEKLMGGRGWISGVPIYETHIGPRTRSEILAFVPLTVLLIGVVLFGFFRSAVAVLIPLLTSGVGTWVVIGMMGALHEPITITGMLLPSVLLALGCAYVMHILVAARWVTTAEELVGRVCRVAPAIAVSGLTTAIGFLAIATVRIDAIRSLGAYGGLGVLVVLGAALTGAPAALRLWPLRHGGGVTGFLETRGATWLAGFDFRRRRTILVAWAILTGVTAVGLSWVAVETDAVLWWPKGTRVRDSYEAIRERLSGISPVNIVIESREGRSVVAPDVLAAISRFGDYLNGLQHVGKAVTVADPLRQLNGGFSGDETDPLPTESALIAQYLLLLESVEHLRDVVADDHQSANVVLRVDNNGSEHLLEVANEAEAWWRREGPAGFAVRPTGIMYEFARSEDEIAWGQIRGLTLAFAAVALVLLLVFGVPKVAGTVMLPNVAPLIVIYGIMGWLAFPLDAGTVCLGSLALGIAVDDSIHIAATYLSLLKQSEPGLKLLEGTFSQVLPAVVMTSIAIGIGFAILGFSEFTLTRNLGLIIAFLVAICLAADATLLPALLLGGSGATAPHREGAGAANV
jgi:predicted RND superfamily exporter protein